MRIECSNPEEVVKEAFWLAYQAAGRTVGMGVFQARSDATKDDVWKNVQSAGDYPVNHNSKPGRAYGDYVFGRMCKLGLEYGTDYVECKDEDFKPRPDRQAWCGKYLTYESLVRTAISNLAASPRRQVTFPGTGKRLFTPISVQSKEQDNVETT